MKQIVLMLSMCWLFIGSDCSDVLPGKHQVFLVIAGEGAVTFDPPGMLYPDSVEVTLSAFAKEGWRFEHWIEDGTVLSNSPIISFFVIRDVNLIASFSKQGKRFRDVTLSWNAVTEPDPVKGWVDVEYYTAWRGNESEEYVLSVDVPRDPNAASYSIAFDSLDMAFDWYFAVTATDSVGNRSEFSDEVFLPATYVLPPDTTTVPPDTTKPGGDFTYRPGDQAVRKDGFELEFGSDGRPKSWILYANVQSGSLEFDFAGTWLEFDTADRPDVQEHYELFVDGEKVAEWDLTADDDSRFPLRHEFAEVTVGAVELFVRRNVEKQKVRIFEVRGG